MENRLYFNINEGMGKGETELPEQTQREKKLRPPLYRNLKICFNILMVHLLQETEE